MGGVAEESRRRIAGLLCLVGVGLILTGLVLAFRHRGSLVNPDDPLRAVAADTNMEFAQDMKEAMFWLLVLMGVFGLSSLAFLRWSRRFRGWVLHRPHPPTPADDVWVMHRLPEESPPQSGPPDPDGRG